MDLYILIYAVLTLIAIVGSYRLKNESLWTIISFVIIVSFQGFRWRTGTDWNPYLYFFENADDDQLNIEIGYYYFNKIIRLFTDSYTVFLLIECTIIAICQISFAKQFSINNKAATLLYFFSTTIFPVRYTLATAIFLLSYKSICNRNLKQFLIFYIIACSIHQIIIVTLPLYFISAKQYNSKTLFIIYIISCALGLLSEFVLKNLTDALSFIYNYLPSFSQNKVSHYMNEYNEPLSLTSTLISYINGAIFIAIFIYFRSRLKVNKIQYNILLNIYVFGLSFSRIVLNTVPYLARINLSCAGGFVLILLFIIQKTNPNYRWMLTLLFCLYTMISYIGGINAYEDLYLPYYSIFSTTERGFVY